MLINPETREALEKLPPILESEDEPFETEPDVALDSGEPSVDTKESAEGTRGSVQSPGGSRDGTATQREVPDGEQERADGERASGETEGGTEEGDKAPVSDDGLDEAKQKAATYDSLVKTLADNPTAFVQHLIANLTPEQRATLGVQQPQAQQSANESGWEDEELTPPEKFVKQYKEAIADLPKYAEYVNQRVNGHEQYIVQALNENAVLKAQLAAVQELLEIKFPEAKFTGYDPKAHEAYQKEVAKAVTVKKASKVETPKTPLNTAGGGAEQAHTVSGGGDSFTSLFKAVKRASA